MPATNRRSTTVLVHHDVEPQPWYGRERTRCRRSLPKARAFPTVTSSSPAARADRHAVARRLDAGRARRPDRRLRGGRHCRRWPDAATVRRLMDRDEIDSFGNDGPLAGAAPLRQIEVDILADRHGNVWVFGDRDVSVRRGDTPLIVEAPFALDGRAGRAHPRRGGGHRPLGRLPRRRRGALRPRRRPLPSARVRHRRRSALRDHRGTHRHQHHWLAAARAPRRNASPAAPGGEAWRLPRPCLPKIRNAGSSRRPDGSPC